MKSKLRTDKYGNRFWNTEKGLSHYHREDGPAIEWKNGSKQWWIDGRLHREDGPAIEYLDGDKEWYYHGKFITNKSQEEFEKQILLLIFE